MDDRNVQQKIQQRVIERIVRDKIAARSHVYFMARLAILIIVSLLVLTVSAYVLSFIAFSLHESGEQFLLGFGGRGVWAFLVLFPWIASVIDIALIILLEWLLQSFRFGYRISLLTLLATVVVASALIASVISVTSVQRDLLKIADQGDLPVIGEAYESIRDSHEGQGIFRGTISAVQGDRMTIGHDDRDHDADDGTHMVILPAGYPAAELHVGERVYVFGAVVRGSVQAYDVDRLSPDQ